MANNTSTTTSPKAPSDFKAQVLGFKTRIFTNEPMADPRALGVFAMTRVIPVMEENNEVAFFWNFRINDVMAPTQRDYDTMLSDFKRNKLVKCEGDTEWFYDFKKDGKTRRCLMTTEIWHKKGDDSSNAPLSPFAMLFGQFFGYGIHIVKCRFVDAPSA